MTEEMDEHFLSIYRERAQLVALIAAFYPSVIAYNDELEPTWPVIYISTPFGQLSWHLAESDMDLFGHVERANKDDPRAVWDHHTTAEKYDRVRSLIVWIKVKGKGV